VNAVSPIGGRAASALQTGLFGNAGPIVRYPYWHYCSHAGCASILGVVKRGSERRVRLPHETGPERRACTRYPLSLEVRYASTGRGPVEAGSGRTVDLSSSGLIFTSDRPLQVGRKLDVAVDWPVPLDGCVQLQLIMSGVVVRVDGTATALEIRRYEFKTRRVALKAEPPLDTVG
jgi:hypothetical protein